jgi:hypothetical protein
MNDVSKTTLFPSTTTVKRFVMRLAQAAKLITQYGAGAMGYFRFIMMTPIEGSASPTGFTMNNGVASSTARRQRRRSY